MYANTGMMKARLVYRCILRGSVGKHTRSVLYTMHQHCDLTVCIRGVCMKMTWCCGVPAYRVQSVTTDHQQHTHHSNSLDACMLICVHVIYASCCAGSCLLRGIMLDGSQACLIC